MAGDPAAVNPNRATELAAQGEQTLTQRITGALGNFFGSQTLNNLSELSSSTFRANYGDDVLFGLAQGYAPDNPMYNCIITQVGAENRQAVGASAPPDFSFDIQNNFIDFSALFEAVAPNISRGGRAVGILAGAASTSGMYNQARIASFQLWGGTSPLVFPLQIEFKAFKDPVNEVIQPVRNLLWMASGESNGVFLNSPSPSIADAIKALASNGNFFTGLKKSISVRIGKFFLAGLVIENMSIQISNVADRKTGLPHSIKVSLSFKSIVSYSREEIFSAFYGTGFGTQSSLNPIPSR